MGFLDGLGLMCYNGTSGLIYYASQARRILISNGGNIATVLIGSSSFANLAQAVPCGVVASRGGTWLAREIDSRFLLNLAQPLDWLLNQVPPAVARGWCHLTRAVGAPQRLISTATAATNGRLYLVNDLTVSVLVAPVVEELIFRGGQEALRLALARYGVPAMAATTIAMVISQTLFAGAHNPDPRNAHFKQMLICGIVFGVMMHRFGLPAAMMTHALNNVADEFERRFF